MVTSHSIVACPEVYSALEIAGIRLPELVSAASSSSLLHYAARPITYAECVLLLVQPSLGHRTCRRIGCWRDQHGKIYRDSGVLAGVQHHVRLH